MSKLVKIPTPPGKFDRKQGWNFRVTEETPLGAIFILYGIPYVIREIKGGTRGRAVEIV